MSACAVCHTTTGVRLVGSAPTNSGPGTGVYGCPKHGPALAVACDDIVDDLDWLQRTLGARRASRAVE